MNRKYLGDSYDAAKRLRQFCPASFAIRPINTPGLKRWKMWSNVLSMKKRTIFISSVQKELAEELRAIRDFVRGDPLLRRFFEAWLLKTNTPLIAGRTISKP